MPRLFLRPTSRGEEEEEDGSGVCGVLHAPEQLQQQHRQGECEGGKTSSGGAAAVGRAAPSASFNQDASCIAVAEKHGFCIFSADPLGLTFRRELHPGVLDIAAPPNGEAAAAAACSGEDDWELVMVEMLYTCNLLALVGRRRRAVVRRTEANEYTAARGGGKAAGFPTHAAAASSSAAVPSSSAAAFNGEGEDVCALWDDRQAKVVVQVQFRIPIRGVQLLKEVLLIILDEKICVYRLHDLFLLDAVPTCCNPTAICAAVSRPRENVSSSASGEEEEGGAAAAAVAAAKRRPATAVLLACPAVQKGQVQLLTYTDEGQERASREEEGGGGAEGSKRNVLSICAHDNPIAFVCLSADGQLLGTASTRGTLFRIFDTSSGALLLQLRRGSLPAQISCLAFSPCRKFFACCSSTGTAHIYKLQQQQLQQQQQDSTAWGQENLLLQRGTAAADEDGEEKEGGSFRVVHAAERKQKINSSRISSSSSSSGLYAMLGTIAPQTQAERSFAQFKLPAGAGAAICTFGRQPHTLLVLTAEKLYYKLKFDEEGRSPITVAARDEIFVP